MVSGMVWEWLGDPLAVDFANTVRRRGGGYVELLTGGADVAEWAGHQRGRVPAVTATAAQRRLDEIRAVRDDVFAILLAAARREQLPPEQVHRINARTRAYPVVAQLGDRAGTGAGAAAGALVRPAAPVDELLARVATATVELVGADTGGLGFCDAPSCGQFFVRGRTNQRWCGPACGTRARVARHAHHASR